LKITKIFGFSLFDKILHGNAKTASVLSEKEVYFYIFPGSI
jgi:hypothetical protein